MQKCENQKYGTIYDRQQYEVGKFITKNGKKELHYGKFIKKMKYNVDDVKRYFSVNNIDFMDYFIDEKSKSRGRPRKETMQSNSANFEKIHWKCRNRSRIEVIL